MIDYTKPVQTVSGEPVEIITTQGRGDYPVLFYVGVAYILHDADLDGKSRYPENDLINVPEKPKTIVRWINLLSNSEMKLRHGKVASLASAWNLPRENLMNDFGVGEWNNEPDLLDYETDDGLHAVIIRYPLFGNLCGYVGVAKNHPWFNKHYDEVDADAHGGLTYSDNILGARNGKPDLWYFGFDCGHYQDFQPGLPSDGTYRNINYVKQEIASLSQQIAKAKND